ncbi:MAG: sigma factor, partial [Planctomycetota bacterium]
ALSTDTSSTNTASTDTANRAERTSDDELGPGGKAAAARRKGDVATAEEGVIDERFLSDRRLVDRCVAGEVAAWQQLYEEYHRPLLRSLSSMLAGAISGELADELAARVWCTLAENDGAALDRYDPRRGARFITFLRLIARDELKRHFRSEGRRRQREIVVGMSRQGSDDAESALWAGIDGFVEGLTPAERRFFDDVLVPSDGNGEQSEERYSKTNRWQLRHRIREKLQLHLGM